MKMPLYGNKIVFCCSADMEATYAEYEEWSEQGVSEGVIHQYRKALKQLEKCKPYEESLVTYLHSFFQLFNIWLKQLFSA